MVVLPSNRLLDLLKLRTALGTEEVRIEDEREFMQLFPDCEAGAMPPLGSLYQVASYVDQSLLEAPEIIFNAGTHRESLRISTDAFKRISDAEVGDYAAPAGVRLEEAS